MVSTSWIAASIDWLDDNSSVASASRFSPSTSRREPLGLPLALVVEDRVGRTVGPKRPRENEAPAGRHERGRLFGDREDVRARRTSAATLREAAEGPGASAGLRIAAGCCTLLGHGAPYHATRRIFAAGLQKGLSRWALCARPEQKRPRRGRRFLPLDWDKRISPWRCIPIWDRSRRDRSLQTRISVIRCCMYLYWSCT